MFENICVFDFTSVIYEKNLKTLGQTNLIFRFAGMPAWYFFQIEIKISHKKINKYHKIFIRS